LFSAGFEKPEPRHEIDEVESKDDSDDDNITSGYTFLSKLAQKYDIEEVGPEANDDPDIRMRNERIELDHEEQRYKDFLEMKRNKLQQQARLREEKLRTTGSHYMKNDDIKEKLEIPAYQRRQVRLNDAPPSSESNVSRYNLNDDDEIMGNNKFLHDNVD
jgi:cell division protein FtsZ